MDGRKFNLKVNVHLHLRLYAFVCVYVRVLYVCINVRMNEYRPHPKSVDHLWARQTLKGH